MWRFIVVSACMFAFGYYSSINDEEVEPWVNEENVVIEYSEGMLQNYEGIRD